MFLTGTMAKAIFFFAFGVAWLLFGAFMVAKPQSALHSTQWPWTRLPAWGMKALGVVILAGAALWFYPFIARLRR